MAGSEYYYDSPEELQRKVNKLQQLAFENEQNLAILKQAISDANKHQDSARQLEFFVLTYYKTILPQFD